MRYTIMLQACLQEHEGRDMFIKQVDTLEEARQWIADQKDEFFHPSDYYVLEPVDYSQGGA
jgi:hypothetical protein